ncbi:MAG: hypothetical protein KDA86_27395, partial [Planctomycetaceae bacterium]|nr:hypothetical protein [Planctomycetaceae bacterium]
WLWMTHRIDRFWVPMIPLLTLLAAAGLQRLAINVPGTGLPGYVCGALLAAVGCVWTSFNLGFITFGLAGFSGFLLDQAAAREIAQADVVTLCHHAGVQGGDKVLIVGEAAVFDADFPYVYNTVWDDSFFEMWCAEPVDGIPKSEWPLRPITAIRQSFADEGITHICVRWDEVLRYRAPGSYGFTDFVHPAQFEKLVKEGLLERTPYVHYPEWEYVDDANRQLIADWAPELRVQSGGKPAMRRIEIYRVKP